MGIMIKSAQARGFTILELMITVTIAGILAAFALPSFTYTIQNGRVKTAASDIHSTLMYARSEAVKRNDNVVVSGISGGWQVMHGTTVLYTKNDLPTAVQISCKTTPCPSSITFNRSGRPDVTPELRVTSTASNAVAMRCVSINLTGQPRVRTDTDSNTANGCN